MLHDPLSMLLLYAHPRPHLCDTDTDVGLAVHRHKTGGTVANGTEQPSGPVKLRTVAQDAYPGGVKGGGNGLGGVALHFLPIVVELNLLAAVKFQNGVIFKPHISSSPSDGLFSYVRPFLYWCGVTPTTERKALVKEEELL